MAEFNEVMRQYKRMCDSNSCIECPMYCQCGMGVVKSAPDTFEKRVMEWAEAHPEPVYPTWIEWMRDIGLAEKPGLWNDFKGNVFATTQIYQPIPADIAEKLGIKPKEG